MAQLPAHPIAASDNIIEMQNVNKAFGDHQVIEDASLSVKRNSVYAFIGPSGSGKTTVIRLLNGVYAADSGRIQVLGKDPSKWSQGDRARIGYMPQFFVFYPNLSLIENLNFVASTQGLGLWERRRPRRELLEFVGLWEHRHKLARSVSGGMQRRLDLACAMIHDPELVFLDEPTAGIDPVLRASIWERLKTLPQQGKTLFITTQYVTEAEYCDQIGLINKGRLVAQGTPDDIRKRAYGGEIVRLRYDRLDSSLLRQIEALPDVVEGRINRVSRTTARLLVDEASTAMPRILQVMTDAGASLDEITIEELKPGFDDVFVRLVKEDSDRTLEQPV